MTHLRSFMLWTIALAGLLDLAANYLAAHVLLSFGTFLVPGGTFVFAVSFTMYDFLRRQYGITAVCAAATLGFTLSILYTLAFGGGVARIAIAGIIALACSSTTDIITQTFTLRFPIWRYVLSSNAISLLVDTVVFTSIAFALLPLAVRLHIMEGQYTAKLIATIIAIPLVYAARSVAASRTPAISPAVA